jgi:hypothetical protein
MEFTPESITDLEGKHGTIEVYESDFGAAAFRPARPPEWQRFLDEMNVEGLKSRALRNLVFACCVAPDRAEFEQLIQARPGLVQAFGNQLIELCGMHTVRVRKKS